MKTHTTPTKAERDFNAIVESLAARGYNVKVRNTSDTDYGFLLVAEVSASNRSAHVYLSVTFSWPSANSTRKRTSIRSYGRVTHFGRCPARNPDRQQRVNLDTAIWWLDAVSRNAA
jgi:hypothetical protein